MSNQFGKSFTSVEDLLNGEVPVNEISEKDGGYFQDIRVIENLLDELTEKNWERVNHKYGFHKITEIDTKVSPEEINRKTEVEYLSTSFELILRIEGEERRILCGSMIRILDYQDNPNLIMTGISEATKAGTKILGRRFGKFLNDETPTREERKKRSPENAVLMKPDAQIMKKYAKAIIEKDQETINKLTSTYDIKQ